MADLATLASRAPQVLLLLMMISELQVLELQAQQLLRKTQPKEERQDYCSLFQLVPMVLEEMAFLDWFFVGCGSVRVPAAGVHELRSPAMTKGA
jgi:hypothetical protein